jgi:branched-chain amino acid transport system permease protein
MARDLLGAYTDTWLLWYGLVFMVMVIFKPEGIAGAWQSWRNRPRKSVNTSTAATGGAL